MDGLNDIKAEDTHSDYLDRSWLMHEIRPENFSEEKLNIRPTGAMKNDAGKRRFSLLATKPLEDLIDVFEFGAKKYGDFNWQKGFPYLDLYNAAQRHLLAWQNGEDLADDSKLNHLAHAAANIHMLLELLQTHPELDNRHKK